MKTIKVWLGAKPLGSWIENAGEWEFLPLMAGGDVTNLATSYMQKRAAEKAAAAGAEAQRSATQMGIDEMRRQFDIGRSDMAPYYSAGTNALFQLQDLLGIEQTLAPWQEEANTAREKAITEAGGTGPGKKKAMKNALAMPSYALPTRTRRTPEEILMQDPSVQFRLKTGQNVLERSAAAGGDLFSGRTGKALTDYGQNFASTEFQNIVNRLAGISGTGQSTAATTGAWGNQFGRSAAEGYDTMGRATSNALLAKGAAQAGFYGDIKNMYNKGRDAAMYAFL